MMRFFEGWEKPTERCARFLTSLPEGGSKLRLKLLMEGNLPRGPSTVTNLDLIWTLTDKLSAGSPVPFSEGNC